MDLIDAPNTTALAAIGSAVWNATTRVLTTFGFMVNTNANSTETAIKNQTDKLLFDGSNNVKSAPQTGVTVATNNDKAGYGLTAAYDPAKTASQAGDAMTLTSGERTSVASTIATALFVDGGTNKLKINDDHSVNAEAIDVDLSGIPPISITIPAAVAAASQDASVITCLRGDTLRVSLPLMGSISSRTKLVMTAKSNINDTDDHAVFQVVENVGLVRLNGGATSFADSASLIVIDQLTGAVDLQIDATITAQFSICDLIWDVQVYLPSSIVSPISGTLSVVADVTQAVT
jgi:hypothetical protein